MNFTCLDNYKEVSEFAAKLIHENVLAKPDLLLCTASGGSPLGTYQELVNKYNNNPEKYRQLRILKLDEWGGVPMDNEQTCESYIQANLVKPLKIEAARYISFDSNSPDKEKECERVASYLKSYGPIDICVLGLGLNGHVAFNEPGDYLLPVCHITELSTASLQHPMAKQMGEIPKYGLSIGMKDILQSRKIILILTGKKKELIVKKLFSAEITTNLPASFLWLHPDTECLVDSENLSF